MKGKERYNPSVLLLGMVFAHQATEPKRGQEFRDRVRCESVSKLGFQVFTLDDKHSDTTINEHCQANFADTRRMMQSIHVKWPENLQFDEIILDYFFSPVGWARCRWGDKFFSQTLPTFAVRGLLRENGKIWLPNLPCIEEQLNETMEILSQYYTIEPWSNPADNPLFRGTETVEAELLRCPDALTNETQMKPLLEYSRTPFYRLSLKDHLMVPRSPVKVVGKSRKLSEILDGEDSNTSTPKKRRSRLEIK